MYSNLPRDRTHFHQLGACECECFHLAGILIAEDDLKQELLGTLATGKYPILFSLDRVAFQVLVIQALALGTQYSEWAGGIAWLLNLVNKRPVWLSYVGHQAVRAFVVFFYLGCICHN